MMSKSPRYPRAKPLTSNKQDTRELNDEERRIEGLRRLVWGVNYKKLPFPVKLHMLLSFGGQFSSSLWWTNRGTSFAVDREGFKRDVMNVFFDEHKFRSFQTLLHKYGFQTIASFHMIGGNMVDIIVYGHKLFVENDTELSKKITRRSSRQSSSRHQAQVNAPSTLTKAAPIDEMLQTPAMPSLSNEPKTVRRVSLNSEDMDISSDDELLLLAEELSDIDKDYLSFDLSDCSSLSGED